MPDLSKLTESDLAALVRAGAEAIEDQFATRRTGHVSEYRYELAELVLRAAAAQAGPQTYTTAEEVPASVSRIFDLEHGAWSRIGVTDTFRPDHGGDTLTLAEIIDLFGPVAAFH